MEEPFLPGHEDLIQELPEKDRKIAVNRGVPVYEAFKIASKKVTFYCPVCNRSHFHGIGRTDTHTHRLAHCSQSDASFINKNHGYFLIIRDGEFIVRGDGGRKYLYMIPDTLDGGWEFVDSLQLATRFTFVDEIQHLVYDMFERLLSDDSGSFLADGHNAQAYSSYKDLADFIKSAIIETVAVQPRVIKLKVDHVPVNVDSDVLDVEAVFADEDEDEEDEDD